MGNTTLGAGSIAGSEPTEVVASTGLWSGASLRLPPRRLAVTTAVAALLHVLLLWLLAGWSPDSADEVDSRGSTETRIEVTLQATPPPPERPARVESAPPPAPVTVEVTDRSHRAEAARQATEPPSAAEPSLPPRASLAPEPRPPVPVETEPESVRDEDRAAARAIISELGRYRLDTPTTVPTDAPPPPLTLGAGPTGPGLAALLDHDEIDLPFADTKMDLVFYAPGVRGDLQRLGDAVTKRFGFKTPGGVEVECAWMVVIVACGW